MSEYIALIHKEPTTGFGSSFPDFPGAVTVSETLEELRASAEEALAFHMDGMLEDGEGPCSTHQRDDPGPDAEAHRQLRRPAWPHTIWFS